MTSISQDLAPQDQKVQKKSRHQRAPDEPNPGLAERLAKGRGKEDKDRKVQGEGKAEQFKKKEGKKLMFEDFLGAVTPQLISRRTLNSLVYFKGTLRVKSLYILDIRDLGIRELWNR